jgi:hypothetical protein
MKKVIILTLVLFLVAGVSAMADPISVKAEPGTEAKIYIWPSEPGQLINLQNGEVDENGTFSATFFSLNVPDYRLKVMVIDNGKKIAEGEFLKQTTDEAIIVDCTTGWNCTLAEELEEILGNETIEVEEIIENETENNLTKTGLTGQVTSKVKSTIGDSGIYYYGGAGLLIFFLALFFVVKMAYRSGARDELKLLSKSVLDKKIDNLAD